MESYQIDPELIKSYIRQSNEFRPQYKDIWYGILYSEEHDLFVWRLEDEDGYCMFFNTNAYRISECFDIFIDNKQNDKDWNYGTSKIRG